MAQSGMAQHHTVGPEARVTPMCLAKINFPGGTLLGGHFTVVSQLRKPIGVLIGRDILERCRLNIDFTRGTIEFFIGV